MLTVLHKDVFTGGAKRPTVVNVESATTSLSLENEKNSGGGRSMHHWQARAKIRKKEKVSAKLGLDEPGRSR